MPKKTDDQLLEIRERFKLALEGEAENRQEAADDVRFENGDQWDERAKTDRAGRPCPVVNKVSGVVKQIVGDARQNRPRIKIRPVDSVADPKTAEILTGLIRNIENVSDAEAAYDNGFECAARGGLGYWRVLTEYADEAAFEQDILIKRIVNPFSVYFDPNCVETDFSDAQYAFITDLLTEDQFERQYPRAGKTNFEGSGEGDASDWFTDDKVRVAEYWYKEPAVKELFELQDGRVIEVRKAETATRPATPETVAIDPASGQPAVIPGQPETQWVYGEGLEEPLQFRRSRKVKCHRIMWLKTNGQEILEGPTEWAGKYIPIVPCLGEEVWVDGRRVLRSAIRFAKEPQRMYNWARANAIEIMALGPKQPWIGTSKHFEGHEQQWQISHTRPMPYLMVNSDPTFPGVIPQRQVLDVDTSGIHQESLLSSDDIKSTTGIYDASLGARGNETSGRAIIARQREGDTATFVFSDNQVRAVKYTGKILVDLIPKIYDTERVVRLLGDDLKKTMGNNPTVNVDQTGLGAWAKLNITDPATGKIVANDLSLGRYDVVIDAGPGYMTRRMEAADGMVQLVNAFQPLAPVLVPRIARNLDWPEATEIADEIKQMSQPQQPPPDPKLQLELQGKQLDNQGKVIDLQSKQQDMAQQGQQAEQRMAQIAQQATILTLRQIGLLR